MNFKDLQDAKDKYEHAQDDTEEIIYGWTKDCRGKRVESVSVKGPKGETHHTVTRDIKEPLIVCGRSVYDPDVKSWRYIPSTRTMYWWDEYNPLEVESAEYELAKKWDIKDNITHRRMNEGDYDSSERKLTQAISHGSFLLKPHQMPSFKEYLRYHNSPLYNHTGD